MGEGSGKPDSERRLRYRTISGIARPDEERYPGFKDFDTALNEAVNELYLPMFPTFRVTPVEGNVLFSVMTVLNDTPDFIGTNFNDRMN